MTEANIENYINIKDYPINNLNWKKNIRDQYIIMVGGAPLNEEFGTAVGADVYCRDAADAADQATRLMNEKHAANG